MSAPRDLLVRAILPVAAGIALGASLPAQAGTATVTSDEGGELVFEYAGGDLLRVNTDDSGNYMVIRDDTLYVVTMNEGQPMVMNASSMMKGMAGVIGQAAPSAATAEVVSLTKTGRRETVAGIEGDVYELTVSEDGKERTTEIVMSGDRRAREFRDAMFAMARASAAAMGSDVKAGDADLEGRLQDLDQGVLRVGQDMIVTAIDGKDVAVARFELPAEPMNMEGLGAMFGSMSQGAQAQGGSDGGEKKSGGLFSGMMGAFGGKAEEKTDKAADQAAAEVDQEADESIDKGIKKAFGKLFGN
jgi:hypothetical protein